MLAIGVQNLVASQRARHGCLEDRGISAMQEKTRTENEGARAQDSVTARCFIIIGMRQHGGRFGDLFWSDGQRVVQQCQRGVS